MLPETTKRVEKHTSAEVNNEIQKKTEMYVKAYGSNPETLDQRLVELENEWDIERAVEVNGSIVLLAGIFLGTFVSRWWFALTALAGSFLLQHAVQGWCPPVGVLRKMGIRTSREIEDERFALKVIRGDFKDIEKENKGVDDILNAVRH